MVDGKIQLVSGIGDVWKDIGNLEGRPRLAAIAYLGENAPHLLGDFGAGDVVVCDASDSSIRSMSTSRKALNDLVKRGVHVYSLANLHAKVICIGKTAVVGSMNASTSSTSRHEAAVFVTSDKDVRAARQLIRRFASQAIEVDEQFLRRIGKLKINRSHQSFEVVGESSANDQYVTIGNVFSGEPPQYVKKIADETIASQPKRAGFKIGNCWAGRGERRNLNLGELVIWVYSDRGSNPKLEIGRIIDFEKIRDRWVYFDLTPTRTRPISLNQLKKSLATMQYRGNLDDLGSEWRRIRLPGIESEIERLFGESAPPKP